MTCIGKQALSIHVAEKSKIPACLTVQRPIVYNQISKPLGSSLVVGQRTLDP